MRSLSRRCWSCSSFLLSGPLVEGRRRSVALAAAVARDGVFLAILIAFISILFFTSGRHLALVTPRFCPRTHTHTWSCDAATEKRRAAAVPSTRPTNVLLSQRIAVSGRGKKKKGGASFNVLVFLRRYFLLQRAQATAVWRQVHTGAGMAGTPLSFSPIFSLSLATFTLAVSLLPRCALFTRVYLFSRLPLPAPSRSVTHTGVMPLVARVAVPVFSSSPAGWSSRARYGTAVSALQANEGNKKKTPFSASRRCLSRLERDRKEVERCAADDGCDYALAVRYTFAPARSERSADSHLRHACARQRAATTHSRVEE